MTAVASHSWGDANTLHASAEMLWLRLHEVCVQRGIRRLQQPRSGSLMEVVICKALQRMRGVLTRRAVRCAAGFMLDRRVILVVHQKGGLANFQLVSSMHGTEQEGDLWHFFRCCEIPSQSTETG